MQKNKILRNYFALCYNLDVRGVNMAFYESLKQDYLDEYNNVFGNTGQDPESIKTWFQKMKEERDHNIIDSLDSKLFIRNANNDSIQVRGETTTYSNFFKKPSFICNDHIGLSDIDILEVGLRFIDIYDSKHMDYKENVLPLLIVFICLKSNYFVETSKISYQHGMFTISFSSRIPFRKQEIPALLSKDLEFSFFEFIGLVNKNMINESLRKAICAETKDGLWHSFILVLDESAHKTCISSTRYWLSYCGKLTRKEIEECTNHKYSERSINDAIHKLVENGEVEIIGSPNAPNVKYHYIGKEEHYI